MSLRYGSPRSGPVLLSLAFISFFMLAGLFSGISLASDKSSGNLIFILDASGSMGAKIQGKMKMDLAKEALSALIKELPSQVQVGLVAYGHRQKGDCKDVEELTPLGPLDRAALIKQVKGLNHMGKTPITFSVRQVAESLKTLEEETTIVLVSDGEETCEGDPCALTRELKQSGIKFVMHVIGFDVSEKEKKQLACIAEAGGGSYFSAGNASELGLAARKAVEKIEQATGKLKVTALRNGKPFAAYCEISRTNAGEEEKKENVAEGWTEGSGIAFKLLPGKYDVIVRNEEDSNRPVVQFAGVTVEGGKSIEKTADFSGGGLKVRALRNGKPLNAYSEVYKATEEEGAEKEKVAESWTDVEGAVFKLSPGVYDVVVKNEEESDTPFVRFAGVAVEAGKSIEKVAEFSGGSLRVKALRNGKPFNAYCKIFRPAEEDGEEKIVTEAWTQEAGALFKLSPGVYNVRVQNEEDAGSPVVEFAGITVEAAKIVEKVAEFSGGTLKVKSTRNGKPIRAYCNVFRGTDDEEEEEVKVAENWVEKEGASFRLALGTYYLMVEDEKSGEKKKISGVQIEAGKIQTVEIPF
ncbi:MAG: VWA domain-containing protein [Syntrophobacteraceae bacterium]